MANLDMLADFGFASNSGVASSDNKNTMVYNNVAYDQTIASNPVVSNNATSSNDATPLYEEPMYLDEKELEKELNEAQKEEGKSTDENKNTPELEAGVFYSFPVRYSGSIRLKKSIFSLDSAAEKEIVGREAIARCCGDRRVIESGDSSSSNAGNQATSDYEDGAGPAEEDPDYEACVAMLAHEPVENNQEGVMMRIVLSPHGILTADLNSGRTTSRHSLTSISYALGVYGTRSTTQRQTTSSILEGLFGSVVPEKKSSDYVMFIAKTGRKRYCHVFDCKSMGSQVIGTIGQIFRCTSTSGFTGEQQNFDASPSSNSDFGFEKENFGFQTENKEVQEGKKKRVVYEDMVGGDDLYTESTVDDWSMYGTDGVSSSGGAKPQTKKEKQAISSSSRPQGTNADGSKTWLSSTLSSSKAKLTTSIANGKARLSDGIYKARNSLKK
eukprot:m.31168 g.31168  ORF g.31168 m.31168 type:complete len:441 (+) comp8289_c0_seq2:665-1987(+)